MDYTVSYTPEWLSLSCYFWWSIYVQIFCPLKNWVVYFWDLRFLKYILDEVLYQIFELRIFCLGLWLLLTFSGQCLPKSKNYWFWWSPVYCFFPFMDHAFGVYYILNAQENLKKSLDVSFHITPDKNTKNLYTSPKSPHYLDKYILLFVCIYPSFTLFIIDKTSQFICPNKQRFFFTHLQNKKLPQLQYLQCLFNSL